MTVKSLKRSSLLDNVFYRSMLAGNEGYDPGDEFLLEEVVLDSSAASVTFSSLGDYAGVYQHLQIRMVGQTTGVSAIRARINGDTGSNYYFHALYGTGSSVLSAASGLSFMATVSTNSNTSTFSVAVMDILDPFETTKNTTVRLLGAQSTQDINLISNLWNNTDAVSSISLFANSGSLIAGSRFSLYGSK